jgi:hypothetical protein
VDFNESAPCRMAYRPGTRLRESDQANFPGRLRPDAAAGVSLEWILADVLALIGAAG